jgi:hypothetical protein
LNQHRNFVTAKGNIALGWKLKDEFSTLKLNKFKGMYKDQQLKEYLLITKQKSANQKIIFILIIKGL